MNELIKLLKSTGFKWVGSSILIVTGLYVVSLAYKNYVEIKRNRLESKLTSLQILEYKEKYAGIMQDDGANTNVKVKENSKIA